MWSLHLAGARGTQEYPKDALYTKDALVPQLMCGSGWHNQRTKKKTKHVFLREGGDPSQAHSITPPRQGHTDTMR